jgi:ATP-dependent DNA ligase
VSRSGRPRLSSCGNCRHFGEPTRCERIVYVDHLPGIGPQLFEAVRQVGAEGIVSKRRGSIYLGRESRDWLTTKCTRSASSRSPGSANSARAGWRRSYVAEEQDGVLRPVGQVRFGFAGKGLWHLLDKLRADPARKGFVPVPL